jgi:hypothetical protein
MGARYSGGWSFFGTSGVSLSSGLDIKHDRSARPTLCHFSLAT